MDFEILCKQNVLFGLANVILLEIKAKAKQTSSPLSFYIGLRQLPLRHLGHNGVVGYHNCGTPSNRGY
jgi:hypothetical protein